MSNRFLKTFVKSIPILIETIQLELALNKLTSGNQSWVPPLRSSLSKNIWKINPSFKYYTTLHLHSWIYPHQGQLISKGRFGVIVWTQNHQNQTLFLLLSSYTLCSIFTRVDKLRGKDKQTVKRWHRAF